jgi:2-phosphosulfolactate phosphatase
VFSDQAAYDVRFEWGADGLAAVGPVSDVVVLVDVLSFGTCVDVATARGAFVLPYPRRDESAERCKLPEDKSLWQSSVGSVG